MPPKKTKRADKDEEKVQEEKPSTKKVKKNEADQSAKGEAGKVEKKEKKKREKSQKKEEEEEEEKVQAKPEKKGSRQTKEMARQSSLKNYTPVKRDFDVGDGRINKQQIFISSWNVNGLRAALSKNDLQNYIKNSSPDILCLNETKMEESQTLDKNWQSWVPSEYTPYFNCCQTSKGYSGTAILTKYKPLSVSFEIGVNDHDLEGRTITLEFEHFFLVACYVPNAGQKLERLEYRTKEWDNEFRNYLLNLKSKKRVILCGDLNVAHEEIDIHKAKGNEKSAGFTKEERKGFTDLLNSGFIDTFRHLNPKTQKFSYWSARFNNRETNKGWRLDYFVVDKDGMGHVVDSTINNDIKGSDHCPIELLYKPNQTYLHKK